MPALAVALPLGACARGAGTTSDGSATDRARWPAACREPAGDASQTRLAAGEYDLNGFTLRVTATPRVDPVVRAFDLAVAGPSMCRRLVSGGAVETLCGMLPAPTDPCRDVGIGLFATDLHRRVLDVGLESGVYIDHVEVYDWADLDRASVAVADALRAWRLTGSFRVEVRPMHCVDELEAT